jgi:hypothetical protein
VLALCAVVRVSSGRHRGDSMIGLTLLVFGILSLIALACLEAANRLRGQRLVSHLAHNVVGSRTTNLLCYSVVVVLLVSGWGLMQFELSQYSGILFVTLVSNLFMLTTVAIVNKERFSPSSSRWEPNWTVYFEAIKNVDPEEGIEYIVNYIQNPKWGCPPKDLPDFLFAMAERTDGFGEVARKKISELGLLQDV